MSKEEKRFELWVNKFRNELAEGQIEVLQDSLSTLFEVIYCRKSFASFP